MAVASPSMFGFVARMISSTRTSSGEPVPLIRWRSSATRRSSGPIPSIGEIDPWSTWYSPRNSRVLSSAMTSGGSCTTQMMEPSRRESAQ
jgi:hypothetical protein